jgi:hypothetical protein
MWIEVAQSRVQLWDFMNMIQDLVNINLLIMFLFGGTLCTFATLFVTF